MALDSNRTSSFSVPKSESYFKRCARVRTSVRSFTATKSISSRPKPVRRRQRPIRPNPFIPTLIAIRFLSFTQGLLPQSLAQKVGGNFPGLFVICPAMECPATEHCANGAAVLSQFARQIARALFSPLHSRGSRPISRCAFDPQSGTTRASLIDGDDNEPTNETKSEHRDANRSIHSCRYLRFAAHARMNENWDLAQLFQVAADTDRTEHFAEEADLAGLVRVIPRILDMLWKKSGLRLRCTRFAKEATADGDLAAAALFEKMQAAAAIRQRPSRPPF